MVEKGFSDARKERQGNFTGGIGEGQGEVRTPRPPGYTVD
jgi:hypothetical protein